MTKTKTTPALYVAQEPIVRPGQPVTVTRTVEMGRVTEIEPREGKALMPILGRPGTDWWVIFGKRAEAVAQPVAEERKENDESE